MNVMDGHIGMRRFLMDNQWLSDLLVAPSKRNRFGPSKNKTVLVTDVGLGN